MVWVEERYLTLVFNLAPRKWIRKDVDLKETVFDLLHCLKPLTYGALTHTPSSSTRYSWFPLFTHAFQSVLWCVSACLGVCSCPDEPPPVGPHLGERQGPGETHADAGPG